MKLDLLTNAAVVDDAIRFVSQKPQQELESSHNINEDDKEESKEPDYNEDEDKLEEKLDNWSQDMRIVPVNFNTEHKAMLGYCKMIFETDSGGKIAINPDKFDKLITTLRTAVDIDGTLDKDSSSYNDIFDAFRFALKFYHFRDSSEW